MEKMPENIPEHMKPYVKQLKERPVEKWSPADHIMAEELGVKDLVT